MYRARYLILVPVLTTLCFTGACMQKTTYPNTPIVYPETAKVDQIDVLHGQKIADPYRWLEDLDSAETAEWVAAQNEVTFAYLDEIPVRQKINDRITELFNYERYGMPWKRAGRYFYSKNDGLQNQSVLYVMESLGGDPRVLLNPNLLSADGTIALAGTYVSEDAKLMAYGLSSAGSDWVEFKVRNIDTGEDLEDHLKWIKFSGASWSKDGSGFYYSRFDEPQGDKLEEANYYQKLCYHRIGTPQADDPIVYERPDQKEWGFGSYVTDDGRYLIIYVSQGTDPRNRVYYQDLKAGNGQTIKLLDDFDASYSFIDNDGPVFWFQTDLDAPRGRVIAIDTRRPERENWVEAIPECAEVLRGVNVIDNKFVANYLKDAHTVIRMFDLEGKQVRDVELPGVGSAGGFGGRRHDTETFYSYTSFGCPPTIYRYDMPSGRSEVYRQPAVKFDPNRYVTKQVFYSSKDDTRVPMFITHKKGLRLDGSNPTLLYGYGGFNVSLTPWFSVSRLVWMELGGVFAVPNLRGGGEYGKEWHDGGRLHNKQNGFDDFIAAAEYLIGDGYTQPKKLAISGASNGGLLVGACMVQRPDLFGACLPDVGVLDMLRFHKFTIGWAWTSDYGDPDDADAFKTLLTYSPLHNVQPGACYPPTMVTTADHDDRVVPSHSFKFISALQAAQGCDNPVLIRIETKAGHGGGKPTSKIIEEIADAYGFLVRVLDMDDSKLR